MSFISSIFFCVLKCLMSSSSSSFEFVSTTRKKATDLRDKIKDADSKLFEARVDRRENEREKKMNDALESMRKLYPGVRGRVFDLCTPTQSRYKIGITVILGKK